MTLTNNLPPASENRDVDDKRAAAEAIATAVRSIDERYDGYRRRLVKAVHEIIRTHKSSAAQKSRNDKIDKIIEVEGRQLITEKRT